jgi:hypothetical protein
MADISKCSGANCPLKKTCYRYTAISNEYYQSYSEWFPAKVKNKWTCDGYESNKGLWRISIPIRHE